MACNRLELFLSEHECAEIERDGELHEHMGACRECREYLLLTKLLASQTGHFDKAPETVLYKVRQAIHEQQNRRGYSSILDLFRPLVKPAIAFSALLLIAVVFSLHLKNSPVGIIENLADQFNISEFRNIQTGDVLYVGKRINVDCTLDGNVKIGLDSNTVLQVLGKKDIALFRGQVRIATGKNTINLETPNGVLVLNNAKIKVQTALTKDNGSFKARTSCSVYDGRARIGDKALVTAGQEIVLAENGAVEVQKSLPPALRDDQEFWIGSPAKNKVFTAKEQLCDCLFDMRYNPDENSLHEKEMKENKFPVRIFWQNTEKIESMRRFDEAVCLFNAAGDPGRNDGNSPGI
jgi:hypothetical protein